jgi:amidohydrolase
MFRATFGPAVQPGRGGAFGVRQGVYPWQFVSRPKLSSLLVPYAEELIDFRRDLHQHPEIARTEVRTTAKVAQRLQRAELTPMPLPGTGLIADIGTTGPIVALRADLDALPQPDESGGPYASTIEGLSHSCGHDVHAAALLGAGLVLNDIARAGGLNGRVRLIFQAAEEVQPGGALDVIAAGGLDGVERAFAVHCDPRTDVGLIGLRVGPITSAADHVLVRLTGSGGHTSRPHLTEDVVFALAEVVTGVPAVLSRRLDPRAGVAMVWGRINAGAAGNAIPRYGEVQGTLRCLDSTVWAEAGAILADVVRDVVRPYGVRADVVHTRGVPPTVNDMEATQVVEDAVRVELGEHSIVAAEQSLGGEDFAWILEKVPGAMLRLGTRTPGGRTYDLHQPDFTADERAVEIGARVLAGVALWDLDNRCPSSAQH